MTFARCLAALAGRVQPAFPGAAFPIDRVHAPSDAIAAKAFQQHGLRYDEPRPTSTLRVTRSDVPVRAAVFNRWPFVINRFRTSPKPFLDESGETPTSTRRPNPRRTLRSYQMPAKSAHFARPNGPEGPGGGHLVKLTATLFAETCYSYTRAWLFYWDRAARCT